MILHTSLKRRTPRVTACCRRSRAAGIRGGLPLAEARALAPQGLFLEAAPEEDRTQLTQLAWRCQRYTPRAGLENAEFPESLWLDVTGCVSHFGDIWSLCDQVTKEFHDNGYRVRLAVAPTWGAAWALARYGYGADRSAALPVIEASQLSRSVGSLPVEGLRLSASVLALLHECGLDTIGHSLNLPRSTLPSRFGAELLLRIDQLLGEVEELLHVELPPQPIRAERRFEIAINDEESVLLVLRQLLDQALEELQKRQRVTQHLQVGWQLEVGEPGELAVRLLRPTAQADRVWELLQLQMERLQLSASLSQLSLEVTPCRPDQVRRTTLFENENDREREFLSLIERLSSRLGESVVLRMHLLPEAQPELAGDLQPWIGALVTPPPVHRPPRFRPLRLFSPAVAITLSQDESERPARFRWQQREWRIALADGPERIETGWWRSQPARRDYFRVETTEGCRFWLYRNLRTSHWFLHGLFE